MKFFKQCKCFFQRLSFSSSISQFNRYGSPFTDVKISSNVTLWCSNDWIVYTSELTLPLRFLEFSELVFVTVPVTKHTLVSTSVHVECYLYVNLTNLVLSFYPPISVTCFDNNKEKQMVHKIPLSDTITFYDKLAFLKYIHYYYG